MKLRFPWYVRLAGLILGLNGPIIAIFVNPYCVWGGKENESSRRFKAYHQVHYKNEADVQVHTEESKKFYEDLASGNIPKPMYAKFLTDEEISENGLYVIGAKLIKKEESE